jgi:hypothetical protein
MLTVNRWNRKHPISTIELERPGTKTLPPKRLRKIIEKMVGHKTDTIYRRYAIAEEKMLTEAASVESAELVAG